MHNYNASTAVFDEVTQSALLFGNRQDVPTIGAPPPQQDNPAVYARALYGDYATLYIPGVGNVRVFVEQYAIGERRQLIAIFRHPLTRSLAIGGLSDNGRAVLAVPHRETESYGVVDHSDGSFTV